MEQDEDLLAHGLLVGLLEDLSVVDEVEEEGNTITARFANGQQYLITV